MCVVSVLRVQLLHSLDKHLTVGSHLDSDSAILAELHPNDRKTAVVVDFYCFDLEDLAVPPNSDLAGWKRDRGAIYRPDIGFALRFKTESAQKVSRQEKAYATTRVE